MRHTCCLRKREKNRKRNDPRLSKHQRGPRHPRLPAVQLVAVDNGLCFPRHKVFSVPAGAPLLFFFFLNGGIGCVQHSTSAARRVINHRVKEAAGAQRPPEVEKRPNKAYRDPGHPWRPGSASIGSKWKRREEEEEEEEGTDPIWFTLWHEVRYSDKHTSPPSYL